MDFFAIALAVSLFVLVLLSIFVYSRKPLDATHIVFAGFCLFSSGWIAALLAERMLFLRGICSNIPIYFAYAFASLITPAILHFIISFYRSAKLVYADKYILRSVYLPAIIFSVLSFTPLMIKGAIIEDWGVQTKYGPLFLLFGFYFIAATIILWVHMILIYYRIEATSKRQQMKYIIFGLAISFLGGISCNLIMPLAGMEEFVYIGPSFTLAFAGASAYAILKYRLMDIRLAVTKATIFFVVYTLTLGLPFWLFYATKNAYLSLTFAMALAFAGPIVHRMLQGKAEAVLLAKQKQYQRFLSQAARGMSREHNLQHLLNLIVHVIKHGVRPQFAGVFLFDEEHKRYELKAIRGGSDHKSQITGYRLGNDDPLVEALRQDKKPLGHEELNAYQAQIENYKFNFLAHLIVPAFSDNRLLGFLVLGEKEDHTVYTEDDVSIFSILAQQAAMAIDNCLYMEAAKRNQQQLFEAEKLASVGGMAAGMSHQFKNRLNSFAQIGGGVASVSDFIKKELPDIMANPAFKENIDYLDECARDIDSEVKRCNALVQGVIGYARERSSSQIVDFSFKEAVDSAIYLVKIKHQCMDRELPFTFSTEIAADNKISTVKGYLNEILFNLLDNAYESIEEKVKYRLNDEERAAYKPQVNVSLVKKEETILITVSDNGTGIKDEDKHKIFAPFFTTKASVVSGMGLGMYIIRRMVVEQMGGKIWFESDRLNGVTFFIELPNETSDGQKYTDKSS